MNSPDDKSPRRDETRREVARADEARAAAGRVTNEATTDSSSTGKDINDWLDLILGFINFSSGSFDANFFSAVDGAARCFCARNDSVDFGAHLGAFADLLSRRLDDLRRKGSTFSDSTQATAVIDLSLRKMPDAILDFHRDLLFHQTADRLFNSFQVALMISAVLRCGHEGETASGAARWDPRRSDDILSAAIERLNHFIGHRPVATLQSHRCEPYVHEWVCPSPLYLKGVGTAAGRFEKIVEGAIELLAVVPPDIARAAQFDYEKLVELAVDPRAFDFDHPANHRPNHQFGQWDPHAIDSEGYYYRFVVQQLTVDLLLDRVAEAPPHLRDEHLAEASAVLAGTVLMASGICGSGPSAFDSTVTLGSLMPVVANLRDRFYEHAIGLMNGPHLQRLTDEMIARGQPFAAARQDINARLAQNRARQLVRVRLASCLAKMGFLDAANRQASDVPAASARIVCRIECLLADCQQQLHRQDIAGALDNVPQIRDLMTRGIECGAIVDPWNMLGFEENYELFHDQQSAVRDHRIDLLVEMVEQTIRVCSRAWSDAAGINDEALCRRAETQMRSIVKWWHQFAPHEVFSIGASNPEETFQAARHVAEALSLWQQGGAAAGDIEFWANHAAMFDSPKAYALVIDALLQRNDPHTPVALMIHWLGNSPDVPLVDSETSIHEFIDRWILEMTRRLDDIGGAIEAEAREDAWRRIRRFYDFIEANAGIYWQVPGFELGDMPHFEDEPGDYDVPLEMPEMGVVDGSDDDGNDDSGVEDLDDAYNPFHEEFTDQLFESDGDGHGENDLYRAAYDDVVYKDSTDDGVQGDLFGEDGFDSEEELEDEVDRVNDRLEFILTLATFWKSVAVISPPRLAELALKSRSARSAPPNVGTGASPTSLQAHREMVSGWRDHASNVLSDLKRLLAAVNAYPLPRPSGEHESLLRYDRHRLFKETLLGRVINASVTVADALVSMKACCAAVDWIENEMPVEQNDSENDEARLLVAMNAAILLRDRQMAESLFSEMAAEIVDKPLLYVPLSRNGEPEKIFESRLRQSQLSNLLGSLPMLGLLYETYQLTQASLLMESRHGFGSGAVTEFDDSFQTAYAAGVKAFVYAAQHIVQAESPESDSHREGQPTGAAGRFDDADADSEGSQAKRGADERFTASTRRLHEPLLFECLKLWTEWMLRMWIRHSRTLRLSVMERVFDAQRWEHLVDFIETFGADLFTQTFLYLGNIRAILHQGVESWFAQLEAAAADNDAIELPKLIRELDDSIDRKIAAENLTIVLEAIIENYNEYRDYNGTTTQSDHGDMLFVLLDFLRLRAKYDRVAWRLKPVVWAHELLVREDEVGVAKLWRRSLADRVGPEADQFYSRLEKLQQTHSVQMATVADRLSQRFMHAMHVDRMKALVGPAMADPSSVDSQNAFEILEHETESLVQRPLGIGLELPKWISELEDEIHLQQIPPEIRPVVNRFPLEPQEKSLMELQRRLLDHMENS